MLITKILTVSYIYININIYIYIHIYTLILDIIVYIVNKNVAIIKCYNKIYVA